MQSGFLQTENKPKAPNIYPSCQQCEYGDLGCVGQQDKLLLLRDLGGWGELEGILTTWTLVKYYAPNIIDLKEPNLLFIYSFLQSIQNYCFTGNICNQPHGSLVSNGLMLVIH